MIHRVWSSIVEVPYCFSRSYVKIQGHSALKIVEFDPNWEFSDCISSLNSPMAMKCCTELETANERCAIVFQGHPSNFKVTRYKTSPILTQIGRFRTIGRSQLSNPSDLPCLSLVTLKFDGWPWKTIGHLFYTTSSFVHHFKSIGELKLKLQSGNAQFGSKSAIFFVLCDLEIWWMTLQNNRAPLLYYIKLCASFQIHRWIETEVTVRKCSIWVKISNFLSRVTLKFDGWPWKTIGHIFYAASSFVHHFTAIGEFKLQLQSGNAQFWSKSTIFLAVWPRNLMDNLQKQ